MDGTHVSSLDPVGEARGSGADGCLRSWEDRRGAGHLQTAVYTWRAHEVRLEKAAKVESSRERALERENRRLKEALATKVLEADFLQGVLRRIEARRQPSSGSGETASTKRSE